MGKDVKHWLVCPGGFQVIGLILGEAAVVEDAELAARSGPYHRIRLSTIVDTRPPEYSSCPDVVAIELPTALDDILLPIRALFTLHVDTLHPTLYGVGLIYIPRATATGLFRTYDHPVGISPVPVIDIVLYDIVISMDIHLFHDAETSATTIGVET